MSSSDNDPESVELDFQILQTRAAEHTRQSTEPTRSSAEPRKVKVSKKSSRQNVIKCNQHEDSKDTWTSTNSECKLCTRFGFLENVKECVLPRVLDVMNLVLTLK